MIGGADRAEGLSSVFDRSLRGNTHALALIGIVRNLQEN